jgi:hypothetical protein
VEIKKLRMDGDGNMQDRVNEIRERLNKATPGPWEWQEDILCKNEPFDLVLKPFYDDDNGEISTCIFPNDRYFIANSPADISYLLDQITAMQEENAELKNQYKISRDTDNGALEEYGTLVKELRHDNATLKKALLGISKLVSDYGYCTHFAGFTCDKDFPKECPKCITNYFKRLALSAINSQEGEKEK